MKDGSTKEFKTKNKLSWVPDSQFGKRAWHFNNLEGVYSFFPQLKSCNAEFVAKSDEIRLKLQNKR